MTVGKLISTIIELRGLQYDTDLMAGWINEIEGQVVETVLNTSEGHDAEFKPIDYDIDSERVLSAPDRFCDLYVNYLLAKIDFHNQETERYNNDVIMFNSSYAAYAAWHTRTHMPKQPASFSKF